MKLKLLLACLIVLIPATSSADPHQKVCTGWETDTYTSGTYFIHHKTYDTIGPLDKTYVVKFCVQYNNEWGDK